MSNAMLDDGTLSPLEKLTWMLIASYKDGCALSLPQMGERLGVSSRSCMAALRRLEKSGLVETAKKGGCNGNFYRALNSEKNDTINSENFSPFEEVNSEKNDTINSENFSPFPPCNNIKKNIKKSVCENTHTHAREKRVENYAEKLADDTVWMDGLCASRGIAPEIMRMYLRDFLQWCKDTETAHTSLSDAKRHFVNQLKIIMQKYGADRQSGNSRSARAAEYAAVVERLMQEN